MTAIPAARQRRVPTGAARVALVGILVLLAAACASVVVASVIRSPVSNGTDALRFGIDFVPVLASFVTAGFLVSAPRLTPFSAYLAVALVLYVVGGTRIDELAGAMLPGAPWFAPAFTIISCFGFLPAAYLFPSGRFVPRWSRWLLAGWVAAALIALAFPWGDFPPVASAVLAVLLVALLLSLVFTQVYRYRRVSTAIERQQAKWLLLVLGIQAAWLIVVIVLPMNSIGNLPGPEGEVLDLVIAAFQALVLTALAVAIGFAMLRYRLFEVDLVIGRALVSGAITLFVLGSYAVLVGAVGLVWPAGTPVVLPVLATFVAATGAAPIRRSVQRRVNRWLYGQRDEPAAVLSKLGDALSSAADLDGTLARIAGTVQETLRFPAVRVVALDGDTEIGCHASGDAAAMRDAVAVPIRFEQRAVGSLVVAPRSGERITPRDLSLLERLASGAGVAIHTALITEQLRQSRVELVRAREQERRRLHRDLHDGLGPTLASVHQRMDLAERALSTEPERARIVLQGARAGVDAALVDLRALVDSLRPAALDRFGLIGAVRDAWCSNDAVNVGATSALPRLPVAVESAAYRIAMEAISNATRHSGCDRCTVDFNVDDACLVVCVADNGSGIRPDAQPGGGSRTMRERAQELGGSLTISSTAAGTAVTARLPLVGAAS